MNLINCNDTTFLELIILDSFTYIFTESSLTDFVLQSGINLKKLKDTLTLDRRQFQDLSDTEVVTNVSDIRTHTMGIIVAAEKIGVARAPGDQWIACKCFSLLHYPPHIILLHFLSKKILLFCYP